MAKRERNKRAARKARQAERERVSAAQAVAGTNTAEESKSFFKKSRSESRSAKSSKGEIAKTDRSTLTGKIIGYFQDVRSEMRKVTWPSRTELRNYSVAVVVMLVVFGLAIWLVDTGIVAGLVTFTGLRG